MNTIKCDLCGGSDIIKQDGIFVCRQCGAKYSIEEAKSLLGSKVSDDDMMSKPLSEISTEELYRMARTSKASGKWEVAYASYFAIMSREPNSWEAVFYIGYHLLRNSSRAERPSALDKFNHTIGHFLIDLPKLSCPDIESRKRASVEMAESTDRLLVEILEECNRLYPDHMEREEYEETIINCAVCYFALGNELDEAYPYSELQELSVKMLKKGIQTFFDEIIAIGNPANISRFDVLSPVFDVQISKIRKYDPAYVLPWADYELQPSEAAAPETTAVPVEPSAPVPEPAPSAQSSQTPARETASAPAPSPEESTPQRTEFTSKTYSSSSNKYESDHSTHGCYIATAVYGSYDCPQVWILRRFRDFTLAETWYGRSFVRIYYAVSPVLVRWFGNSDWFRKLCKKPLDRFVSKLHRNGVSDTRYIDRNW